MKRLLAWVLKRWADAVLRERLRDLEKTLDRANLQVELLKIERDGLAAVIARDRNRVQAETAEQVARIAKAGG